MPPLKIEEQHVQLDTGMNIPAQHRIVRPLRAGSFAPRASSPQGPCRRFCSLFLFFLHRIPRRKWHPLNRKDR